MFQEKDRQARAGPCHSQAHGLDRLNNKTKQSAQFPSHLESFIKSFACALMCIADSSHSSGKRYSSFPHSRDEGLRPGLLSYGDLHGGAQQINGG